MDDASYRLLFEAASDGMIVAGGEDEILEVNRRACELLGRERESLVGAGWPGALGLRGAALEDTLSGLRQTGEIRTRTEPGGGSAALLEVAGGSYRERTGERRVSLSLREPAWRESPESRPGLDEDRLRRLLWSATEILAVLEPGGEIRYGSPAVGSVLGYEPGELAGRQVLDLVHPEDAGRVSRALAQVAGEASEQVTEEFRLRHAGGSWRVFEGRASNYLDEPGVEGLVVNCRDITERKQVEDSLRRSLDVLLALREAGQTLGSTLEPDEIGTRLLEIMKRISSLTTAVLSVPDEGGELKVWRAIGFESLWRRARYTPEAQSTLYAVLESGERRTFELQPPDPGQKPLVGVCLPLRWRARVLGVLEIYGPGSLQEGDTMGILDSLTGQAASALENARLYEKLSERERRLQELVGQLMRAQEEERRKVAYEVHDGLAQVAAAAHQHLQAFARFHSPDSEKGRGILQRAVELVWQTVGGARRVIADLRPTALDDFGLQTAIRLELDSLRQRGWKIDYEGSLREDQRLPESIETTLFRIVQEALANVQKYAETDRVYLSLDYVGDKVRLRIQDWGRGFDLGSLSRGGPGERVGISSMRERVNLVGGHFEIHSSPRTGTLVSAEIPLPGAGSANGRVPGELEVDGG